MRFRDVCAATRRFATLGCIWQKRRFNGDCSIPNSLNLMPRIIGNEWIKLDEIVPGFSKCRQTFVTRHSYFFLHGPRARNLYQNEQSPWKRKKKRSFSTSRCGHCRFMRHDFRIKSGIVAFLVTWNGIHEKAFGASFLGGEFWFYSWLGYSGARKDFRGIFEHFWNDLGLQDLRVHMYKNVNVYVEKVHITIATKFAVKRVIVINDIFLCGCNKSLSYSANFRN